MPILSLLGSRSSIAEYEERDTQSNSNKSPKLSKNNKFYYLKLLLAIIKIDSLSLYLELSLL